MAVKTFGFIEKFGFEDRFRRPGQHPQWILPVEQQRPDAVFGRAAVGNSVVERQPPCLGQDRRRASADLLLPGSFAAGDKQMAGLGPPMPAGRRRTSARSKGISPRNVRPRTVWDGASWRTSRRFSPGKGLRPDRRARRRKPPSRRKFRKSVVTASPVFPRFCAMAAGA